MQEVWLEVLRRATDPDTHKQPPHLLLGINPVSSLRPTLGRIRFLLLAEVCACM